MSDSLFHPDRLLHLLHEGIPPAPDANRLTRGDTCPTPTADPFTTAELATSKLWPAHSPLPVFSTPNALFPLPSLEATLPWSTQLPAPLYLCGSTTSSMDVARRLIENGQLPVWGSVLALSQSTGRGQLGRSWVSPQGNVYAALRLPMCPPFTETAAAPAVGGLIAEALARLGIRTFMKWPNDLLQAEACVWRKVGGILLEERLTPSPPAASLGSASAPALSEASAKVSDRTSLIAGIGLNLQSCPPDNLLRAQRAVPAGCLSFDSSSFSQPQSALTLWMRLVSQLFICYVEQIDGKESAWRALAERRLAFSGQSVIVTDGPRDEECHRGILDGLELSGGLRLRNGNSSTIFLSGSLQLA